MINGRDLKHEGSFSQYSMRFWVNRLLSCGPKICFAIFVMFFFFMSPFDVNNLFAKDIPPQTNIIFYKLSYYGPPNGESVSSAIEEGLVRRLRSQGHTVRIVAGQPTQTGMDLAGKTGGQGASFSVYGSVSLLGEMVSADLRIKRLDVKGATARAVYGQGKKSGLTDIMDSLEQAITDVLLSPYRVAEVKVRGNRRVDTDAILQTASISKGDLFDPRTIASDIKAIYKMGYFEDVQVEALDGPDGKIVVFWVREKPAIKEIKFVGNKELSEEKIRDVIDLKPYTIINEKALQENVEKIKALYAQKGYMEAVVSVSVKQISEEAANVIFDIQEGDKVQIKKIIIDGNKAFSDEELKELMETMEKKPIWTPSIKNIMAFFKGDVTSLRWDALERDLGRIAAFYHNHGYVEAKVGRPKIKRDGSWLYVTIPVEEGERYGVGKIEIDEDYFKDKKKLLANLQINKEEVFNQEILRRDIVKLTDMYADEGFAYADINPSIEKDPEKKVVNITFHVDKGPKVYFERIEISGNTRTRDKVIRRELRVEELEPFSASGLRKSKQRLSRLGYFEDVNLTPTRGSSEESMKLDVKVKERPTGTFSIGAGYSSVDKLILMGEISQRNFLGRGQTLSFKGILGSTTNRYALSFLEPYFRDTRLSVGTDLYNWERQYDDYTKNSSGGALHFAYPLTDDLSFFWGGRVDNTILKDLSANVSSIILDSLDIHETRSINAGLTYDTRDDFYNPSHGWRNSFSLEYAGGLLGGDSAFLKLEGVASYYHPIWKQLIGHMRGGIGYVTEGSGGQLPVYERFFLGGIDSVRGFKYGRISPIDPDTGDRVGGEYMAYLQTEAIFPLLKDMGMNGVIFLDMGNVWDKDTGYDVGDLRKSVGFGIRWLSPMGPLRIEWGYNIDTSPGDDKSNWEFRMGGSF